MKNLIIDIFLGISVLLSYYIFINKKWKNFDGNYLNHPLWFKLNNNSVKSIVIFQLIAVVCFIFLYKHIYLTKKIKEGILSYNLNGIEFKNIVMKVYLICSILWSIFVYMGMHKNSILYKLLSVVNLIIVAICSILIIAGIFENNSSFIYLICAIFLGVVHIIIDGIGWNAIFIKNI